MKQYDFDRDRNIPPVHPRPNLEGIVEQDGEIALSMVLGFRDDIRGGEGPYSPKIFTSPWKHRLLAHKLIWVLGGRRTGFLTNAKVPSRS